MITEGLAFSKFLQFLLLKFLLLMLSTESINAALIAPIEPASRVPTTIEPGDRSFAAILSIHRKGNRLKPTPFILDTGALLPLYPCSKPPLANTSFTLDATVGPPVVLRGIQVACIPAVRIAGLGPGASSLPAQFARAAGLPYAFSYCLPSAGYGALLVGATEYKIGANGDFKNLKLGRVALKTSSGAYTVSVASIELGGVKIALNRDAHFGTYRRYTALPAAYRSLRSLFVGDVLIHSNAKLSGARFGPLDLCFRIDSAAAMWRMPPMRIAFGTGRKRLVWEIPAANYMVPTREPGLFCVGIVNAGDSSSSMIAIGTFQQQDHVVEFNVGKKTLGISESLAALASNCAALLP